MGSTSQVPETMLGGNFLRFADVVDDLSNVVHRAR
jgi:hypothetical protein